MKKTHWKKLDNPNYLGAYSLLDGETKELTVTIEKVVVEKVKSQRGEEDCKVAYIKGQKPMILNVTNCRIIEDIYGTPYIQDWIGKQVTLYVAKIKVHGDDMEALRIKKEAPKLPELNANHSKWSGAIDALAKGTVTIEEIKKKYTLTDKSEEILKTELQNV